MHTLQAYIQGHYENLDSITYYTMQVTLNPEKIIWVVNRKLEEFHTLYEVLSLKYKEIAYPPGYSYFSYMTSIFASVIPKLEEFLQSVIGLKDVLSCEEVRKFFDVDLHVPNMKVVRVECVREKNMRFPVIHLQCDGPIIILAEVSLDRIHKLEQYLQKIGYSGSEMSLVHCYCWENHWDYSSSSCVTALTWSPQLTILAIGYDSGSIQFLRIKTESNCKEYDRFSDKLIHGGSVIGIQMNFNTSKIYTCGDDCRLIVTSLSNSEEFIEVPLNFVPVSMKTSGKMDFLYITSTTDVYVYDSELLQCLKAVKPELESNISAFDVTSKGNILVGGYSGRIMIYTKEYELIQNYNVSAAVSEIKHWEDKKVVVVGDLNGVVSIWNMNGEAICRWTASSTIIGLGLSTDEIITSGGDHTFKVWSIEGL